jgi:photosystem II stability/assembly factor-like uncharacterized protein
MKAPLFSPRLATIVNGARTSILCLVALSLGLAGASGAESSALPRSEPYVWQNVIIGGGGFVTGIIMHPLEKGLMYARTDVGGAYRWDSTAGKWIPITDWIGMADVNLTGIESLAVDPSDVNRVYLAAGTYNNGGAAILRSTDQGKTFARTDVPFKMGGNEAGRFNGERLAVDPNDGKILFFGSRHDGLWRSEDRGTTWKKVESFPNFATNGPPPVTTNATANLRRRFNFVQQPVGIVCVLFDPGSRTPGRPTPVIYAAASTLSTNSFRSLDGGKTWQAVEGQPVGFCPNHLVRASDGMIYASYGREPGPNTMTDGAIWKFDPKKNIWTNITPLKPTGSDQRFGYGSVTVDAQHPSTIMVTTFCHWHPHDLIFRSTDSGASWTQLWQENTQWDHSSAPYTETRTPHWMGDIEINPFNPDQVLFTTGFGIWSCRDTTAADAGRPTHWDFFNHGLEEMVPLGLISPPEGAHLLSAIGDQDGFRHDDLTRSPEQGSFTGPRFSNSESIAFAGKNPQIIARTGTGANAGVHAAISPDGGKSWQALGSEPPDSSGAGSIALSADGKTIVWTPRHAAPYFSTDRGTNWAACLGLGSSLVVVADSVNPVRFYAFDSNTGRLLTSTNGAVSFVVGEAEFPVGAGGNGGADGVLSATPGSEGDLWLAFRSGGLYHLTNAGSAFTKLGAVNEAYSLGFGKAAPGRDRSALYLAGQVGNIQALFRSDDNGATWLRINDDQHQYGGFNHVTGDPRIYGRVYFATGGRGVIYGDPASLSASN